MKAKDIVSRDEEMVSLFKQGTTQGELATMFHMSRANVALRLREAQVNWNEGGAHVRAMNKKLDKKLDK